MSTTVLSSSDQSSVTVATQAIKSLVTDSSWKGEQKDAEEVSFAAEKAAIKENEQNEDCDSDYNPKDDEAQGLKDQEEDLAQSSGTEIEPWRITEEVDINSEEFKKEWNEAMDSVLEKAQADRERILSYVKEAYNEETGREVSDNMMQAAVQTFELDYGEDAEYDITTTEELPDVDPAFFREEFEEALQIVRNVAKRDQEDLVNIICNISHELVGRDPDIAQLSQIFGRIKNEFAEEAREEFLEVYEEELELTEAEAESDEDVDESEESEDDDEDDEADSDYSPDSDPFDYTKDEEEDQFTSSENEQ